MSLNDADPVEIVDACKSAKESRLDAVQHIVEYCRASQQLHSGDILHTSMAQPILLSIYTLMDELSSTTKYDVEFTELCIYLRSIGRRIPLVTSMLRMVHLQAQQRDVTLPASAKVILDHFERTDMDSWVAEDVNSMYPSGWDGSYAANGTAAKMEDLLRRMVTLEVVEN